MERAKLLSEIVESRDRKHGAKLVRRLFERYLGMRTSDEPVAAWARLLALATRFEGAEWASDPERAGGAAGLTALGDGYRQCGACSDAFEGSGQETACPTCGAATGIAAKLTFSGGGELWLDVPETLPKRRTPCFQTMLETVTWAHARAGGESFVLFDDGARRRVHAALPNSVLQSLGDRPPLARAGSVLTFGRREHGKGLTWDPASTGPTAFVPEDPMELVSDGIARVLGSDDSTALGAVAAEVATMLKALDGSSIFTAFEWTVDANDYLDAPDLRAALASPGLAPELRVHVIQLLMRNATFLPGAHHRPAAIADETHRRQGSPLPLIAPLLDALRVDDAARFYAVIAELLGMVLIDSDVFDHSPDGFHGNVGSALAADLSAAPLATLAPETVATAVRSLERGCDSCSCSQFGVDLVPLALALLRASADPDAVLAALTRFFCLDEDDEADEKVAAYVEENIIAADALQQYATALAEMPVVASRASGRRLIDALRSSQRHEAQ